MTTTATDAGTTTAGLAARGLTLAYDRLVVARDLDLDVPTGGFTAIVGPNGCGKSTLLKALARTHRPDAGEVLLDGRPIGTYRSKEVARRLAFLPQSPVAPDQVRVRDLVGRGRHPYHSVLRQWRPEDAGIVDAALAATGVADLADRPVADLSGGQRQRVWLALVLAQDTRYVLLDEPTTFLDIANQVDLLDLCQDLHHDGRTVVAVLHDLNQAARYATHLVVMRDGAVVAQGEPAAVITAGLVQDVFGLACEIVPDPQAGTPLVVPLARTSRRG
ncbi:ABC transporter ATP-binding protein [Cellulomonas hominis]|uniref:ABC transporter ATP-binding protein n=1 Tax=Cellulomonas hominis TaxID=156981 RepID=UPI001B8ECF53|nr:ABC transporter ATP-binding protein [Cellulomonas hominis]VTR75317.1 Ferric enterobactin transport ATP-binding protein FepC [Cellulomonas hominis]